MAHHQERIKPERGVEHHLALRGAQHGRQPPALARVHKQEDRVVRINELLKARDVLLRLRERGGRDRVPGHRDAKIVPGRVLPARRVSGGSYEEAARARTTPGKIFFKFSAAHSALGLPPSRQSSNVKSGWRTGFENDTRALSTKVIVRTPQACACRHSVSVR